MSDMKRKTRAALHVLDRVADVEPDPGDELQAPYEIEQIGQVLGDLKPARRLARPGHDLIAAEIEGIRDIEEGRVVDFDAVMAKADTIIADARLSLLQRYSAGEADRLDVMERLGLSYSELLDALADAGLEPPVSTKTSGSVWPTS